MSILKVTMHANSRFHRAQCALTQMTSIIILQTITIAAVIQVSDKFIWGFFCLPFITPFYFWIRHYAWRGCNEHQAQQRRMNLTLLGLFVLTPLVLFIYQLVWHPILSMKWYPSKKCVLEGQFTKGFSDSERYSVQYVMLNKEYRGISCVSNHVQSTLGFLEKRNFNTCDNSSTPDFQGRRALEQGSKHTGSIQRKKNLRNLQIGCEDDSSFSAVKIPSWLCQTTEENHKMVYEDSIQSLSKERTCVYAYYGDKQSALQNGKYSQNLKDETNFIIVRMNDILYYKENLFIALIVFGMFPAVLFTCQLPLSYIYKVIIMKFYLKEIIEETLELERADLSAAANVVKSQQQRRKVSINVEDVKDEMTSDTARKRQKISIIQIVQVQSPNAQMNDRDYYDIYSNSRTTSFRRDGVEQFERQQDLTGIMSNRGGGTTTVGSKAVLVDLTKITSYVDFTQIEMKKVEDEPENKQVKNQIDVEGDDQGCNRENLQDDGKQIDNDDVDEDNLSEEEESCYVKIRKIYKRKLDPKYQEQLMSLQKDRMQIQNEENQVIREIKQAVIKQSTKSEAPEVVNEETPINSVRLGQQTPNEQSDTSQKANSRIHNDNLGDDKEVKEMKIAYGNYVKDLESAQKHHLGSEPADEELLV